MATSRFSFVSRARLHLAHPARAERRDDFVGAELRAGCQRHVIAVQAGPSSS
jgi:hypothetical protein